MFSALTEKVKMEFFRQTFAEINLDHLAHNVRLIQTHFPQAPFLCPMVKANSYGHGPDRIAKTLEAQGIRHLGVCTLDEGLVLRRAGVTAGILVFLGTDQAGTRKMLEAGLTPVVTQWEQLDYLENAATGMTAIHLKFDTGMRRLGFSATDAEKLRERLWQNKKLKLAGIGTHLYSGEDAVDENGHSAGQLRQLFKIQQVFKSFDIVVHALNSAGILSGIALKKKNPAADHPLRLLNWGLRPGLMIYGYNPLADQGVLDLKPVMNLKSHAGVFHEVKTGDGVSYNHTWKAARDSVITVVPIGYGDGYHRRLSNRGHALFAGQRVPVVGTVCMDYLMLDVTDVVRGRALSAFAKAEVVLFGQSSHGAVLAASDLAREAQTVAWEMLTSVADRVPRVYLSSTGKEAKL